MRLKFHPIYQLWICQKLWFIRSFSLSLEKEWFDYYKLSFYLPEIKQGTELGDLFEDGSKTYGLEFPTEILFYKSKDYWNFMIKILGFGIGFSRQWGY